MADTVAGAMRSTPSISWFEKRGDEKIEALRGWGLKGWGAGRVRGRELSWFIGGVIITKGRGMLYSPDLHFGL